MAPLAIHIGPGRLGLGLIVDVLRSRCGFDVCLVGRPDSEAPSPQKIYKIAFADPSVGLVLRDVRWAQNAEVYDEFDGEVRARVETQEPLLITCALAGAIAQREALIREILAARPAGAPTLLLSCENDPDDVYQQIADDHPGIGYCACVVDRICNEADPRYDEDGRRVILAHPVGEWVIARQAPDFDVLIEALDQAPEVVIVEPGELPAHKHRKLWCVNGLHMVLALLARRRGNDELPLTDERADAFDAAASRVIETVLASVEEGWGLSVDPAYGKKRVRAFRESSDSAKRIVSGRLIRRDLTLLMDRLNSRLGEAAREAHRQGRDCEPFFEVAELVLATLGDRAAYLTELDDHGRPIPVVISEEVDARAVAMFDRFLTGWLDEDDRRDLVERLALTLAAHRDT